MRLTLPLVACAAALAAAAGPSPAAAGTLQVNPVLVEIGAARRTGAVTVRNVENVRVTIRAYPMAWRQEGGEDHYDETSAIIVSPPVFTIPPGGTQIVRVGQRSASRAPQPYRLIIEEVPEAAPPGGGIRVALRLNLPLYASLAPGAPADLRWSAVRQPDGRLAVEARNTGAGWVRVDAGIAQAGTGIRFQDGFAFGTVLPGGARRWPVGDTPSYADRARFQQILRSGDDGASLSPHRVR